MNYTADDRSARIARWWVQRYTAGLASHNAQCRRAEIDSDIAEHQRCRESDGWRQKQIARERMMRLVRGMAADLGWRRDLLTAQGHFGGFVRTSLLSVTSLASLLLALFHAVFAAYLLGNTSLADQRFLGGLASYADELDKPVASAVAAIIVAGLGAVLVLAAIARPVSPMMANVVTVAIAVWAVLWFWLGMWPIGLIAVVGSAADLAIRTPNATPRP